MFPPILFSILSDQTPLLDLTALGLKNTKSLKIAIEVTDLMGILNCGINFALYTVTPVMRRSIHKKVKKGVRKSEKLATE